ncbi:hypothetical protein LXL04_026679 [Taraxacum kok-saghyz]
MTDDDHPSSASLFNDENPFSATAVHPSTSVAHNLNTQTLNLQPPTSSITLVQFPSSLKLTSTNYLSWKTQIKALLHGLDLFRFIDGTYPSPSPTITDGLSTPHPNFSAWFRQDRLLFGAIVGKTYAKPTRGHIKHLQHRLKHTTKAPDQSITDYMQSLKTIVDELGSLGKQLDQEDITDAILTGLDPTSYKTVIDAIHARDTSISFHELHEKLINHELSLLQASPVASNLHQPTTAFAANKRLPAKPWNNRPSPTATGLLSTPSAPSNSTRPFLGKCQYCFNKGHSLTSCYAFKNKFPHINLPSLPRTTHSNSSP